MHVSFVWFVDSSDAFLYPCRLCGMWIQVDSLFDQPLYQTRQNPYSCTTIWGMMQKPRFFSAMILTLLQNLCSTKKATLVAMGSPAHTDTGGSSALPARPMASSSLGRFFSSHGLCSSLADVTPVSAQSRKIASFHGQDDHLALQPR